MCPLLCPVILSLIFYFNHPKQGSKLIEKSKNRWDLISTEIFNPDPKADKNKQENTDGSSSQLFDLKV